MVEPIEFGEIMRDKCIGFYPSSVQYLSSQGYIGYTNFNLEPIITIDNQLTLNYVIKEDSTSLPDGMTLDGLTGKISGIANANTKAQTLHLTIVITGTKTVETEVDIILKEAKCPADSGFTASEVGQTVEIACNEDNEELMKSRTCNYDSSLDMPKWSIINADACESKEIPTVTYTNEGKMTFTIDIEDIPEKKDVTYLSINDEESLTNT